MAAKRRTRAIARSVAKQQKKNPGYKWEGAQIVSEAGWKIPIADKQKFEALTKTLNDKHDEAYRRLAPKPRLLEGEETGGTVGNLKLMGRELDFILAERKKKWSDFKTQDSFYRYLGRMEYAARPEYIDDRIRLYKRNFINSMLETYGKEAMDIAMKIRMMPPEKYMEMVQQDEALEIGQYGKSDVYIPGMLNKWRRALGMNEKPEWVDETR